MMNNKNNILNAIFFYYYNFFDRNSKLKLKISNSIVLEKKNIFLEIFSSILEILEILIYLIFCVKLLVFN